MVVPVDAESVPVNHFFGHHNAVSPNITAGAALEFGIAPVRITGANTAPPVVFGSFV